jgi:hypothetical protein
MNKLIVVLERICSDSCYCLCNMQDVYSLTDRMYSVVEGILNSFYKTVSFLVFWYDW